VSWQDGSNTKAVIAHIFKGENLAWLLLFLFSLPAFEFQLGNTIDANIRLIQNLNFATNPAALFASHLPQGPLSFLQYPLPLGGNLSIALLYYALIKLGILTFLRKRLRGSLPAMILYATIYLLIAPRLLPLCLVVFLLFSEGDKPAFSWVNIAILSLVLVLLYTRLSLGILAGAMWFVSLLFASVAKGFSIKDALQRLLLLVLLLALFLTPYLFFASLEVVLSRFWALLNVNATYGLIELNLTFFASLALLLAFAFMLFGTISIGPLRALALKPHQKAQAFVLVLYALLYFRSRPEAGTYYVVLNFILIFFFALQAVHSRQLWKAMAIWLAAALLVGEAFLAQGSFKTTELRLGAFFSQVLKPQAYRESFRKDNFARRNILPAKTTYTVLSANFTDHLLEENQLLTSPSYIPQLAQDSLLDSLNTVFFTGLRAPNYLLSQDAQERVFASLPQSRAAFEQHYQFLRKEGGLSVYYKKE